MGPVPVGKTNARLAAPVLIHTHRPQMEDGMILQLLAKEPVGQPQFRSAEAPSDCHAISHEGAEGLQAQDVLQIREVDER